MNDRDEFTISLASAKDAAAIAKLNLFFNEVDASPDVIATRISDPACVETVVLAKVADEAVGFALVRVVQVFCMLPLTPS